MSSLYIDSKEPTLSLIQESILWLNLLAWNKVFIKQCASKRHECDS